MADGEKRRPARQASWLSELLFEHKVGGQFSEFRVEAERSTGPVPVATQADLQSGFVGAEPPKTFTAYKQLVSDLFDAKRQRLVDKLMAQPVFEAARNEWNPRHSTTNANIARELVPYVVQAMQEVYEFSAPPIHFTNAGGFLGTYDMRHHKITLTPQLFGRPAREFVDTLVHEEIHALQADMMLMLNVQKKGRVLTPPERSIAQYWKNEEPKYRSAMAAGSNMSPETKRRYQMIGQEYHAWTTGHYVASRILNSSTSG